jgi:CRISPR-associated endonuclease/helicase Cas3
VHFLGDFDKNFEALTDHTPFPWQKELFDRFVQKGFPETCDLPTGLGKTSIIAIWLLALAHHAHARSMTGFPRRLVYVVNRRTVVDQATLPVPPLRSARSGASSRTTPSGGTTRLGLQSSSEPWT